MDPNGEPLELDQVIERLGVRFRHLSPDVIARAVSDSAADFAAAAIRDYIPLLVEKQARDWLKAQGP